MNNKELLKKLKKIPEPWQMIKKIFEKEGTWINVSLAVNVPISTLFRIHNQKRLPGYLIYRSLIFYYLANF